MSEHGRPALSASQLEWTTRSNNFVKSYRGGLSGAGTGGKPGNSDGQFIAAPLPGRQKPVAKYSKAAQRGQQRIDAGAVIFLQPVGEGGLTSQLRQPAPPNGMTEQAGAGSAHSTSSHVKTACSNPSGSEQQRQQQEGQQQQQAMPAVACSGVKWNGSCEASVVYEEFRRRRQQRALAALTIQAFVRGFLARREAASLRLTATARQQALQRLLGWTFHFWRRHATARGRLRLRCAALLESRPSLSTDWGTKQREEIRAELGKDGMATVHRRRRLLAAALAAWVAAACLCPR